MKKSKTNTEQFSDLKPFKHGQEGTHYACPEASEISRRMETELHCCDCTGHACSPTPVASIKITCLGLDCPERTGGECDAMKEDKQEHCYEAHKEANQCDYHCGTPPQEKL